MFKERSSVEISAHKSPTWPVTVCDNVALYMLMTAGLHCDFFRVHLQRPAVDFFQLGVSGRCGGRPQRLPFSATHHPRSQAAATEDTPRDLSGLLLLYNIS